MLESDTKIGKYRIIRKIGAGGMADVYLAEDIVMRRYVAFKVLPPEFARDPESTVRFQKEVHHLASLDHSNIVTIYDVGCKGGCYYYAMAYLTGGDLKDRIRQGVPVNQALGILKQMADALRFAHAKGLIHRDIKPENILFDAENRPVLSDLGIAKAIGSGTRMTKTGMSIGTPHYMSPEQARGQSVDGRSDLYSLGAIFYEMLTGRLPYDAEDTFAVALKHVNDPLPELPPELSAYQPIIDRLMAKDTADRFSDAGELVRALDALAAGAQISEPKPVKRKTEVRAPASTSVRPHRRHGLYWGLGGALLALVMFGAGFAFLFHEPSVQVFIGGGQVTRSQPDRPSVSAPAPPAAMPPTAVIDEQQDSPPAAPAGTGILKVTSNPEGARVEIDGKALGKTPLDLELPVQKGALQLTKEYYRSAQLPVEIHKDLVTSKNITLERGKGNLTVLSDPEGARVALYGQALLGRTPLSLSGMDVGMAEVTVTLDGYIN